MSNPNENVSRIVRTLLTHQDRTRADLAAHFGVHPSVITKALGGKRSWDVDDIVKLADFFEVSASLFFRDADDLIEVGDNLGDTQRYDLDNDELLMEAA